MAHSRTFFLCCCLKSSLSSKSSKLELPQNIHWKQWRSKMTSLDIHSSFNYSKSCLHSLLCAVYDINFFFHMLFFYYCDHKQTWLSMRVNVGRESSLKIYCRLNNIYAWFFYFLFFFLDSRAVMWFWFIWLVNFIA